MLPSFLQYAIIDDKMLYLLTWIQITPYVQSQTRPTGMENQRSKDVTDLVPMERYLVEIARNDTIAEEKWNDIEELGHIHESLREKFPTNPHRDDLSLEETDVLKTKMLDVLNEHHHFLINYLRQQ